jgi:hypothetical protein
MMPKLVANIQQNQKINKNDALAIVQWQGDFFH